MRNHSKYIRDLADKTGISMRALEAEWKVAERQLDFDILMEPNKWSRLRVLDGTKSEEIARRVDQNTAAPENASEAEKEILPGVEDEGATEEALVGEVNEIGPMAEQLKEETPLPSEVPVEEVPDVQTSGAEAFSARPEEKKDPTKPF